MRVTKDTCPDNGTLWLLGNPVAHSLSPVFQNAGLSALGLEWTYEARQVTTERLPAALDAIRSGRAQGANVTLPHKRAVMLSMDSLDPIAARSGAVNTIVRHDDQLVGYNTDVIGLATDLETWFGHESIDDALVLGAGGAARATILALDAMGLRRVTVYNRTPDDAERLVAELDTRCELETGLRAATLTIHATSLGIGAIPGTEHFDTARTHWGQIPFGSWAYDLTYARTQTPFLVAAAGAGVDHVMDGRGMLLGQGAASFQLWTGQPAPVEVMRIALERVLA